MKCVLTVLNNNLLAKNQLKTTDKASVASVYTIRTKNVLYHNITSNYPSSIYNYTNLIGWHDGININIIMVKSHETKIIFVFNYA